MNIYWPGNYDVMVMKATVYGRPGPQAWVDVCRCGYYRTFPASRRIPILSTLSAGGGMPVVSSGFLTTNAYGGYQVFLPTAPGTSGSLVVDTQGRFVGVVWGVWTPVKGGAGFYSRITPASVAMKLIQYAFDRDGVHYASP